MNDKYQILHKSYRKCDLNRENTEYLKAIDNRKRGPR